MASLRTPEGDKRYHDYRNSDGFDKTACALCNGKPLKTFKYWKVINNEFPYDRIAGKHHMILPFRHVREEGLDKAELEELMTIKEGYINNEYEFMLDATEKKKTIPDHFHLHLIVVK